MPKLTFTQPEFASQVCHLSDGNFTVGRSRQNQIILDDDSVSSDHGELLVHGNEVIVRERGSRNGTFLDGARIQAQSGVKHGQKIRFGRVELRLELDAIESEHATDITALPAFRRFLSEEATPAEAPATTFPVTFAPRAQNASVNSTISMPRPPSAAPGAPTASPSSQGPISTAPGPIWVYIGTAAVLGLLALWWFLTR
jgi:predicted component of type VI protein secretion system